MSNCFPIRDIPLRFIKAHGAMQARVAMDQGAIMDYSEAMKAGARFPPVVLFQDSDLYWLGDGFHRVEAAQTAGKKNIKAEIRPGGVREAQLYAIGANHAHGLRRSNADKRKAVEMLLDDPEWGGWSARETARVAGVSHFLVESMKGERLALNATPVPKPGRQKAAALPPLPDELLHFDAWDEEDAGDEFSLRIEALAKKTGEGTDEGFDAWGAAWDTDHKDAFTRLLVAESWPGIFKVPTDMERDAWLAKHLPAPAAVPAPLKTDHGTEISVVHGSGNPVVEQAAQAVIDQMNAGKKSDSVDFMLSEATGQLDGAREEIAYLKKQGPIDRARLAQLENLLPQKDEEIKELSRKLSEAGEQIQELHEENQAMHRTLDAEDILAQFKKEVSAVAERARVAESRSRGLMVENADLAKRLKSALKKIGKMEPIEAAS